VVGEFSDRHVGWFATEAAHPTLLFGQGLVGSYVSDVRAQTCQDVIHVRSRRRNAFHCRLDVRRWRMRCDVVLSLAFSHTKNPMLTVMGVVVTLVELDQCLACHEFLSDVVSRSGILDVQSSEDLKDVVKELNGMTEWFTTIGLHHGEGVGGTVRVGRFGA